MCDFSSLSDCIDTGLDEIYDLVDVEQLQEAYEAGDFDVELGCLVVASFAEVLLECQEDVCEIECVLEDFNITESFGEFPNCQFETVDFCAFESFETLEEFLDEGATRSPTTESSKNLGVVVGGVVGGLVVLAIILVCVVVIAGRRNN